MNDSQHLVERSVAYFVELHLNSAAYLGEHEHKARYLNYHIEGKPRPMLIYAPARMERDCRWFHVLRITTKGKDQHGKTKPQMTAIGPLVQNDKTSYVDIDSALKMPETLLYQVDGKNPVIKRLERCDFDPLIKIVMDRMMRRFRLS